MLRNSKAWRARLRMASVLNIVLAQASTHQKSRPPLGIANPRINPSLTDSAQGQPRMQRIWIAALLPEGAFREQRVSALYFPEDGKAVFHFLSSLDPELRLGRCQDTTEPQR